MKKPKQRSRFHDLGVRTASGLALALVAILAFRAGSLWSTFLLAAGAGVMLWELHRVVVGDARRLDLEPVVMAGLGAIIVVLFDVSGFAVAMPVLAVAAAAVWLAMPLRRFWIAAGFVYIVASMAALVTLRATPEIGFALIVWLIGVVVAADVGGYFAGRIFGGPKLWPAVSPKKTWSGAVGGWVLALIVGAGFSLVTGAVLLPVLLFTLAIAIASQAGDLAESMVKRHFHVKDSGNFLPGHGGALDRFDGLMAAALLSSVLGFGPHLYQA